MVDRVWSAAHLALSDDHLETTERVFHGLPTYTVGSITAPISMGCRRTRRLEILRPGLLMDGLPLRIISSVGLRFKDIYSHEKLNVRHSNRIRQYPLYSKTSPPPALADHFTPDVFAKSQAYGRDKARFALVSGLYKQIFESAILHYGVYAWAWSVGGHILAKAGYGEEYEVCNHITLKETFPLTNFG